MILGFDTLLRKIRDMSIDGLQSIPGDSKYKDIAAMLVPSTIEANKHSFVKVPPTWPP